MLAAAAAAGALVITAGTAFALNDDDTGPAGSPAAVTATPDDSPSPSASGTPDDTPSQPPSTMPSEPDTTAISSDDAAQIAVGHVGGGDVHEIEREMEHGRLEWKVEVVLDGVEHDVRVDAGTGEITRVDVDDDNDDRRDDDDDHDDRRDDDDHDDRHDDDRHDDDHDDRDDDDHDDHDDK